MKTQDRMKMKVIGGRNLPDYWTRFDELQRTAHKLSGGVSSPRGIFRFTSFEAFEEWKQSHRVSRRVHRDEQTS